MKASTKKITSLMLAAAVIFCLIFGVSTISTGANVEEFSSIGAIETYNLKVGDTKYIFLNESDKAVQSAVWKSNAPFDVEIISQDTVSCQIKVNNYISTTAIITCEYYYQQLNSLTGQIWLIKGAKSFYVNVSEGTDTQTPTIPQTPVVPNNPQGPFIMDESTQGVYTYVVKYDGTAEVTDYDVVLETTIKIPKWMDDYDTTSIGNSAFEYCKMLKKVYFPENVTSIGKKAFYDCEGLQTVVLPQGLTEIGEGAFKYCLKLNEITIPQGVSVIEKETFSICTSLESITIPEGVTDIKAEAFASCTALEKVVIPESIQSIDATAFDECDKENLIIYGYEGTVAESFAKVNGYSFVSIKKITDKNSGITIDIIAENDAELVVKEISDSSTVDEVNLALENEVAIKIYDISINENQDSEVVSVKIPIDNEALKAYKIEEDGKLTKITTRLLNGSLVFNTNASGSFVLAVDGSLVVPDESVVITEPTETTSATEPTQNIIPTEKTDPTVSTETVSSEVSEATSTAATNPTEDSTSAPSSAVSEPGFEIGDVNRDGKINIKDATAIQKYAAKLESFDEIRLQLADINGDAKVNVKDATHIQKKIANLID